MTLIVILIVLGLQRFLNFGVNFPRYNWFKSYLNWLQSFLKGKVALNSIATAIIILLPIIIIVGLMQFFFKEFFFGILRFILDLIVLWYCLDAYQLRHRLSEYFSKVVKQDHTAANEHGKDFVKSHIAQKNMHLGRMGIARAITHEIFIHSDEHLFAVLFWFIVAGPVGALTYYLIVAMRDLAAQTNSEFVELLVPAEKIFGVLDWIPVRIVGISYALVGHFVSAFNYVRHNFTQGILQTQEFAIYSGFAALNIEHVDVVHADIEENQEALALVDRTVFLWIVIVAIFTLGGLL
jgi:AmpE protein